MNLQFTEEQSLLADAAGRLFDDAYDLPRRRARAASEAGFDRELWRQMAELGWLGLRLSERLGGLGMGAVESAIVMQKAGAALALEPLLEAAVLGALLLEHTDTEQAVPLAEALLAGDAVLGLAHAEPGARYTLSHVETTATPADGGFELRGHKAVVPFAHAATRLFVSARTGGSVRDADGIDLFVVDPSADGVSMRSYATIDGRRAAELTLQGVKVPDTARLTPPGGGLALLEAVAEEAMVALAAEALGAMAHLHAATVEYAKTRRQFGRPIAKFQVVAHRLVDMYVALELSRATTFMAAAGLAGALPARRAALAATAKVKAGEAIRLIGQDAVQLHGGMGMTDELDVGHYFKRITMIEASFGDADHHLRRLADGYAQREGRGQP